jgi:hypothetical protein
VDIFQNHMSIEDLEGIEFRDVQAATAHCVASLIELAKGARDRAYARAHHPHRA